jgi:hypothetical protein
MCSIVRSVVLCRVGLFADRGELDLHRRLGGAGVEVVGFEFHVVLGAVGVAAEKLAHEAHTSDSGG